MLRAARELHSRVGLTPNLCALEVSHKANGTKIDPELCDRDGISRRLQSNHGYSPAGDGIDELVLKAIPPSLVLPVRSKSLIVTPGRLLKASREMFLLRLTLSKIVPSAVTRRAEVEIIHSKVGLWSKNVANVVKLTAHLSHCRWEKI